ncbi:MAG: DUF302 domain-containing protein [Rhodomicrobium sp.]
MLGTISSERNGIISVRSSYSFSKTIESLHVALKRRGMFLHACIDHAGNAAGACLSLRPTLLFVFGYPEAEAPIIVRNPLSGLDLPQRFLVWEDEERAIWISYNDPVWLGERDGVPADILPR